MTLKHDCQLFGAAFAEVLECYFEQTLLETVKVRAIDKAISMPAFLEQAYVFFEARIFGARCVLIAARENAATPANLAKHVSLVRSAVDAIVIFATPSLSAHNRSRLIARGVAFVVPGNQLYIPDLAMDLRERFRALKPRNVERLSPAAQAVLFRYVLRPSEFAATPSAIAKQLRYAPMSVGRAFDALDAAGLAKTRKRGKERRIRFSAEGQELVEAARPLLRSPVRSFKHVRGQRPAPELKLAGESALAKLTDLNPPRTETFAVAARSWKAIAESFEFKEVDEFEGNFTVETWSYDPAGLSDGPLVDPLSLYAQFHDHRDERVSMAAQRLLESET